MKEQKPDKAIIFSKFLESQTNLLTIFGIFNALAIWSNGIKNEKIQIFLTLVFLFLSILVLYEIIISFFHFSDYSIKAQLFCLLLIGSEIGIILYMFDTYLKFMVYALIFLVFLGFMTAYLFATFYFVDYIYKKFTKKNIKDVFPVAALSIIPILVLSGFTVYLLLIVLKSYIPEIAEILVKINLEV